MKKYFLLILTISTFAALYAQNKAAAKPRARDLEIPFDGKPGANNAITDVEGVMVGYKTLIKDSGQHAIRTGVTVILPNGRSIDPVPAGWFTLNGDGEMTGTTVIDEYGFNYGPIGITNTNSVGVVRDAIGEWNIKHFSKGDVVDFSFGLPVAAETFDGILNDINGLYVQKQDVFDALDSAHTGMVEEGNVGGGTGMSMFRFKGGSGTSSRIFAIDTAVYTVGVFVQGNFGARKDLIIVGVPVGKEISDLEPLITKKEKDGSIIIIVATNAPLLPLQLKQIAKRASLGVARTGGIGRNGSGDIFLAFSTAVPSTNVKGTLQDWKSIPKEKMDALYEATVQATEEAIINALVAAQTMTGLHGNTIYALPHDRLQKIMKRYKKSL